MVFKYFMPVLVLIAFLVSSSSGQSVISLCGIVTNATGSPISGANIKLQKKNLTAVSAANGSYCINWTAGVSLRSGNVVRQRGCAVTGKKLTITLADGDRFSAALFDIRGKMLWSDIEPSWNAGSHEITLPVDKFSPLTGLLRVSAGETRFMFRFASCGRKSFVFSQVKTPGTSPSLAKAGETNGTLPILDTLVATGSGFAMNNAIRCYVYTFVDTIDFSLGEPDSFSEARQQIVHRVNDYRATLSLKRLVRYKAKDACIDTQAQTDFTSNTAHSAFGHCKESAQNECPGWNGPNMLIVANNILISCMQMMWDEGPGTPYSAHGHYINMTNTAYSRIACGFYYDRTAKTMWAAQDFFQ
jgi:hypothetical protein